MLVDTAHRGQPPKWHATKPRCPGDTRRTCQGCVEQTQTANGLAGLRFLQRVPGLGLTSDRTGGTLITFPFASWVISDLTWVCACECSDRQPPSPNEGRWNDGHSNPPVLPKADKRQPARSRGSRGRCPHPPSHACGLFLPETANAYHRRVMSHGLGSSSKDSLKQETFISCFSSLFSDRAIEPNELCGKGEEMFFLLHFRKV